MVTSRATEITGAVTSADGAAVKDFTLVVFAEDADKGRSRRRGGSPGPGRTRTGRSDQGDASRLTTRLRSTPAAGRVEQPGDARSAQGWAQHFVLTDGEQKGWI
jgi:hypothetical protein